MPSWFSLETDLLDNTGFFESIHSTNRLLFQGNLIPMEVKETICQWCGSYCYKHQCVNCGGPNPKNGKPNEC